MSEASLNSLRTLVIQPLPGIGDMVWYLPYIHAIAEADEVKEVDIFTKKRSMADQLFDADMHVAQVLWFDDVMSRKGWLRGAWKLAKHLRSCNYSRVWVLHESPRYALAAWLAGIPERYGYGLGWQRKLLNKGMYLPATFVEAHPIDKANEFVRLNQIRIKSDVPKIVLSEAKVALVKAQFNSAPKPWIALGIGSSEPYKQWGESNFSQLIEQVMQKLGGTLFVLGGPAEQSNADRIKQALLGAHQQSVFNVIAQPLNEVCALLSLCDLFVGNDTGMLNASAATGTPSIGLFGRGLSSRIVDETRHVYAVFVDKTIDMHTNNPMNAITVSAVMAKVEQILEKTG